MIASFHPGGAAPGTMPGFEGALPFPSASPRGVRIIPEATDREPPGEQAEAAMFLEGLVKLFAGALAVAAGASTEVLKDAVITVQAPAGRSECFSRGISITVEGSSPVLGELARKASKLCFADGAGMCPVRHAFLERR